MKKLWIVFIAIFVCSFGVLGWVGTEIFRQAPPIPREVVTTDGHVLLSGNDIQNGQNVWQAMGGMEMGSIWGHGSYVAPDWTADYLHRESLFILDDCPRKILYIRTTKLLPSSRPCCVNASGCDAQ